MDTTCRWHAVQMSVSASLLFPDMTYDIRMEFQKASKQGRNDTTIVLRIPIPILFPTTHTTIPYIPHQIAALNMTSKAHTITLPLQQRTLQTQYCSPHILPHTYSHSNIPPVTTHFEILSFDQYYLNAKVVSKTPQDVHITI